MFLKPAKKGLIVRHPDTKRPLKEDGQKVQKSSYWLRRLKEGSVIEVDKAESKPKVSSVEQPKKKDGGK